MPCFVASLRSRSTIHLIGAPFRPSAASARRVPFGGPKPAVPKLPILVRRRGMQTLQSAVESLTTKGTSKLSTGSMPEKEIESLVLRLHEIQAVKFGEFRLKSGLMSPIYVDLRVIVSYPDVLHQVAEVMWLNVQAASFEVMCGVPYTALPIATCMSLLHGTPMLMRRKEVKDYGTKKAIEGAFQKGQTCLIVEDLVTSGASVMETVEPLEAEGLKVTDVVVLIDREQGGAQRMASNNLRLHSAFTLSFILDVLQKHGLVQDSVAQAVRTFIAANQTFGQQPAAPGSAADAALGLSGTTAVQAVVQSVSTPGRFKRLPFDERAQLSQNALSRRLLQLMLKKKSNLAVAADVATAEEMLQIAEQVGPHICVFKTHVDIFDRWDESIAEKLIQIAQKHDFLIFEDRKFADIGNTVVSQYQGGVYKIADWADITNAHLIPGPGIIEGLKSVGLPRGRGLLLLAEMSTKGALATGAYTEANAKAAEAHQDFVMGFISQGPAKWSWGPSSPGLLHMTPGVKLAAGGDTLGQQYNTPTSVIGTGGSDIIIVGRGIIKASDPAATAAEYQTAGWKAYTDSLSK